MMHTILGSIVVGIYVVAVAITWKTLKELSDKEYETVLKVFKDSKDRGIF